MKHTIWQNYDLNAEDFTEELTETLGTQKDIPEYHLSQIIDEINWRQLEDERTNLCIDIGSEIIAIADIGRWNGRTRGYKMIKSGIISDCLYLSRDCDYGKFYVNDIKDLCSQESHHDGTNYIRFRAFRKGVSDRQKEHLKERLISTADCCEDIIQKLTKPIGPAIAKVYGWHLTKAVTST